MAAGVVLALVLAGESVARADDDAGVPAESEVHAEAPAAEAEHHESPPAAAPAPAEEEDGDFQKSAALTDEQKKVLGDKVEAAIDDAKGHVLEKMEEKMEAKMAAKMGTLASILGLFSLSGLLLMFMPLFLRKKYPGKTWLLVRVSAVSSIATVVALNLFALVIMLLKGVQGAMGARTNPVLKIVDATFDVLADQAHEMFVYGPTLIQPTLDQLNGDTDEPMPVVLLENVGRMGKSVAAQAETFKTAARLFDDMRFLLEYMPPVMTMVTIVLFAVSAKPVIVDLAGLPARVASGQGTTAAALAKAAKRIGNELLAVVCLIGFLVVVTEVSEAVLAATMYPTVESFLDTFFMDLIYVQDEPQAKSWLILGGLGGTIGFIALNVALVIVSGSLYLGKVHKIFQAKFQEQVPLAVHKRFWLWGSASVVWTLIFPLGFSYAAEKLNEMLEHSAEGKDPSWTFLLLSSPVVMVLGFLVLFWAVRGLKGLAFVLGYNVKKAVADHLAKADAAPAAQEPAAPTPSQAPPPPPLANAA